MINDVRMCDDERRDVTTTSFNIYNSNNVEFVAAIKRLISQGDHNDYCRIMRKRSLSTLDHTC